MSAADSEQAVDRLAKRIKPMSHKERAEYLFLALAILGWNAPDALGFILDHADDQIGATE